MDPDAEKWLEGHDRETWGQTVDWIRSLWYHVPELMTPAMMMVNEPQDDGSWAPEIQLTWAFTTVAPQIFVACQSNSIWVHYSPLPPGDPLVGSGDAWHEDMGLASEKILTIFAKNFARKAGHPT